jgi:hypothetical protein
MHLNEPHRLTPHLKGGKDKNNKITIQNSESKHEEKILRRHLFNFLYQNPLKKIKPFFLFESLYYLRSTATSIIMLVIIGASSRPSPSSFSSLTPLPPLRFLLSAQRFPFFKQKEVNRNLPSSPPSSSVTREQATIFFPDMPPSLPFHSICWVLPSLLCYVSVAEM